MNTVQVLRHLDLPSLLNDDHPDIPYSQENGLQEMNEDLFDTKTEAFAAMMRRAWICPGCSHPVVFDNWISQNSDKQIATAAVIAAVPTLPEFISARTRTSIAVIGSSIH